MKKINFCLVRMAILGGLLSLFTSCSFTGTYFPTKKTIPEGQYLKEEVCASTGVYSKLLDGIETSENIDVTIRRETLTVKGNTIEYTYGEYTYFNMIDRNTFVTLSEPTVEYYKECSGTYTIYTDGKINFDVEGGDYTFQNGSYFDYEKDGNEIRFVKKAILDGSYILGPFIKQ